MGKVKRESDGSEMKLKLFKLFHTQWYGHVRLKVMAARNCERQIGIHFKYTLACYQIQLHNEGPEERHVHMGS